MLLLFFVAHLFDPQYCAAGMLLGLPLSIHRKSYWPVTLAAVAGTAADFMDVSMTYRKRLLRTSDACTVLYDTNGPASHRCAKGTTARALL